MPTVGLNLRVTTDSRQGGRKYMEDVISVKFQKGKDGKEIEFAYFAVFDGHGGPDAALFAKERLLDEVTSNKLFWSDQDSDVMKAISDGFLSTHKMMWKAIGSWPKTLSGLPSTAGSTASVVFIRNSKMYVAHVGDSSVVLGAKDKTSNRIQAHLITEDHKPESPEEKKRIESNGGRVIAKAGVQRVVWFRPKPQHRGPIRRSTAIDTIPFLAVARSLGDLWSYNSERDVFVVSPEPDVAVYNLDFKQHHCVILASDGLWNMIKPQDAVDLVMNLEEEQDDQGGSPRKPASCLVQCALNKWAAHNIRADNTSVICVIFDPPGASRSQIRHMSSASSASTMKISDCDDDISDSDAGESMMLTDESAENNRDSTGLFTPSFSPLSECRHTENRFNCTKPLFRPSPRAPIYRSRPSTPKSAPAKLASASFRHYNWMVSKVQSKAAKVGESNMAKSDEESNTASTSSSRSQGIFESIFSNSNVPFMDPTVSPKVTKSQSSPAKLYQGNLGSSSSTFGPIPTSSGTLTHGRSSLVHSKVGPSPSRTLRSQSPRQVGDNLTNNPHDNQAGQAKSLIQSRSISPAVCSTGVGFPKEATSAKSPIKINTTKQGSPSAGLVSPIWPSSLEIEMGLDIGMAVDVDSDSDPNNQPFTIETSDSCENIENPCCLPLKIEPLCSSCKTPEMRTLKRKNMTPSPLPLKRSRTPSPAKLKVVSQTCASQVALRTRARTPKKTPTKSTPQCV